MSVSIISLTPRQLRQAANIQEKILSLQNELNQMLGAPAPGPTTQRPGKKRLSARGIANIRAGVRKRWAAIRAKASGRKGQGRRKKMSAAAKARLSAIAKARWRKAKAQGKKGL